MLVEERLVNEIVEGMTVVGGDEDGLDAGVEASDVSWFAARQPAIVRYLAHRLGEHSDAMGAGLAWACAIAESFERTLGAPPPRLTLGTIEKAERAFVAEAEAGRHGVTRHDGLAERQPALARTIAGLVASPTVLLDERERMLLGVTLAALTYAFDEAASGRPLPPLP